MVNKPYHVAVMSLAEPSWAELKEFKLGSYLLCYWAQTKLELKTKLNIYVLARFVNFPNKLC